MKKILFLLFFFFFCSLSGNAARIYHEKFYQDLWCKNNNGKSEILLFDKTRVDCLLEKYAIEFDFADKWSEAIGQSLYYALVTNRKPAVVLIIENEQKDYAHLIRLKKVAEHYGIKIWIVTPDYITKNCSQ